MAAEDHMATQMVEKPELFKELIEVAKEFCWNHGLKLIYFECDGSEYGFEVLERKG